MPDSLIGQLLPVSVSEVLPNGYIFDGHDSLFLPLEHSPRPLEPEDQLEVAVLRSTAQHLVCDARLPVSSIEQPVCLTAIDVSDSGALFDWGLSKPLFVPRKFQEQRIEPNMTYLVYPFVSEKTDAVIGATKLRTFFPETNRWLKPLQTLPMQVYAKTQLGYKVLIDKATLGVLFFSDAYQNLNIGDSFDGSIKNIRDDGKIDVAMFQDSAEGRNDLVHQIIEDLVAHEGLSTLTDKSKPDEIYRRFKVSKGAYKKAIGYLYKAKKINITSDYIQLNNKE